MEVNVGIPVGDVLRAFVKGGILRKILDALKGVKITTPGGTDILLNQGDSAVPPPRTGLDQPHKFGPPDITGGRRR
jgi:hypothetical protein